MTQATARSRSLRPALPRGLRILFLTPFYAPHRVGGAELSTELSAQALAARGHRVTVLVPNFGSTAWKHEPGRVSVLRFPFPFRFGRNLFGVFNSNTYQALLARTVRRALRETRAQLIHIQSATFAPAGVSAARAASIPALVTLRDFGFAHNASINREDATNFRFTELAYARSLARRPATAVLYPSLRLNLALRRRALRRAAALVCVSDFISEQASTSLALPRERCPTVYNPAPPLRASRAPPSPNTLLFVGRLGELKGASLLLRAAARAAEQRPITLLVAGDNAAPYRSLAGRLGIADRVRFLGTIPNHRLPHYYAQASAVVLPSLRAEPLSRVLIEAALLGKPVIATRVGGNAEVVPKEFLCDPTPAALGDAMLALLGSPRLQQRCARALKKKSALFSPTAHARSLERLYARVLASPARSRSSRRTSSR